MLESLTVSDFEPRVGERFLIRTDDGAGHDAELVEAAPVGEARGDGGRIPFSLVFRGPAGIVFPQRIYPVHHPELGSLDIFLVPIAADADGVRYEAVFT